MLVCSCAGDFQRIVWHHITVYSWQSAQVRDVFSTWHSCRPAVPLGDSVRRLKKYLAVFYTLCTRRAWWEKQQNGLFEPPTFYKDRPNHGDVSLWLSAREAWRLDSQSAGWSLDVWVGRVVSSGMRVYARYTHIFSWDWTEWPPYWQSRTTRRLLINTFCPLFSIFILHFSFFFFFTIIFGRLRGQKIQSLLL